MWLSENTLKKLIKGTFLATLLLAAQEGGRPFHEAAWILIGATLTTVVDAYATHLSHRSYGDFRAYAPALQATVAGEAALVPDHGEGRALTARGASISVVLIAVVASFASVQNGVAAAGGDGR